MRTISQEQAEDVAGRRMRSSPDRIGAAVMCEAIWHESGDSWACVDTDNGVRIPGYDSGDDRFWSCVVTDDGSRFPSVLVMTPGRAVPDMADVADRLEKLAGQFSAEDRLIALLEAEARTGFIALQ